MTDIEYFREFFENIRISNSMTKEEKSKIWEEIYNHLNPLVPKYLYKFRECNNYNISNFEKDCIVFSSPSTFNDKYDTMCYIDSNVLKNKLKKLIQKQHKYTYNKGLSIMEHVDFNKIAENTQCMIRNNALIKISCFTEDILSKYMWDHYAKGYTGFALSYDFSIFNYLYKEQYYLFPVFYTDSIFDATDVILGSFRETLLDFENFDINYIYDDELLILKPCLYKHIDDYGKEKEWRILAMDKNVRNKHGYMCNNESLKAIYYGQDIQPYYKTYLSKIAKQKGIKEYNVVIDENTPNYKLVIENI